MATALAELFVNIGARTASFDSGLRSTQAKLVGLSGSFGGFASRSAAAVGGLVGSFANLARSMVLPALGGGLAGGGALGFAIKQAADLEQVFSGLRKTTGLTGEPLVKLQDELKAMATTMSGVSFDDLAGIATMGGRMGIAGAQLSRFTRDIAFVSIALDDIPAEESATAIARTLNVFKLGSENAIRFASALNKLDDSSTATGRDILDITARIAPTAATLGLSPQKVLAIATALKDAGAENEVAGSAISQIFGLMAKDIDAFAKVAGVSTKEFTEALRGDPLTALQLLIGNIQKMDKIDAFSAISTLGIDGVRATATLLQLGTVMDRLGGFVQDANSEWSSTASIQAEVAVQGETTYAILKRLGNAVQITAAEIGTFMLPLVKALANSFGELAAQVRGFVAGKAGNLRAFFAPLETGAKNVGLLFSEWPTMLDLAGNKLLAMGVQITTILSRAFSAAGQYLINVFKALGPFLGDLFDQIATNIGISIHNALNPRDPIDPIKVTGNTALFHKSNLLKGVDFAGVTKGLDIGTLDPQLAGRIAEGEDQIALARKAKDLEARNRATGAAFKDVLGNLTTGGKFTDLIPEGLRKRGLDAANRAFKVVAPALDRAIGGPRRKATGKDIAARTARNRADALKKRRADAAALRALTPAQRRQKLAADRAKAAATSQAARRAGVKSPTGAVDILGGIDKTLNSLLKVNTSTDTEIKKGLVAKLGR